MNTAADNILAKSFARERMRIWAPIVKGTQGTDPSGGVRVVE